MGVRSHMPFCSVMFRKGQGSSMCEKSIRQTDRGKKKKKSRHTPKFIYSKVKGHKLLLFIYINICHNLRDREWHTTTQACRHIRTRTHTHTRKQLMYESIILRSQFSVDYCLNYILLDNITYLNVSCKGALKRRNRVQEEREGGGT